VGGLNHVTLKSIARMQIPIRAGVVWVWERAKASRNQSVLRGVANFYNLNAGLITFVGRYSQACLLAINLGCALALLLFVDACSSVVSKQQLRGIKLSVTVSS